MRTRDKYHNYHSHITFHNKIGSLIPFCETGINQVGENLKFETPQDHHAGYYHYSYRTGGVLHHVVYQLVSIGPLPTPHPTIIIPGYTIQLDARFSTSVSQIQWYYVVDNELIRVQPGENFRIEGNGGTLIVSDIGDSREIIAVAILADGSTETIRYDCIHEGSVPNDIVKIIKPFGSEVELSSFYPVKSWSLARGDIMMLLTNNEKHTIFTTKLLIKNLQESDQGLYYAYYGRDVGLTQGWSVEGIDPAKYGLTWYVPADYPTHVTTSLIQPLSWYRISPPKKSLGSSPSITVPALSLGEMVHLRVEGITTKLQVLFLVLKSRCFWKKL